MNPTCREIEGLLSPYLDRELDPLVARRVDEHVSSCPACSEALTAMREAGRILEAAVPLRSEAEWEALALRVEMAIDREEAHVFQEAAAKGGMAQEVMADAAPAMAMRTLAEEPLKRTERSQRRGFGWWAYGSGAIAAAMLVFLLWPWFKEHVEEGPPAPPERTRMLDVGAGRDEQAPSEQAAPEQEKLSAREPVSSTREPASAPLGKPVPTMKRNAAPPAARDLASSSERSAAPSPGAAPSANAEQDAQRLEAGALRSDEVAGMESGAKKQFAGNQGSTQSVQMEESRSVSQQKTKEGTAAPQSADQQASSDEARLEKSAPSGSTPSAPEAVPEQQQETKVKGRASTPQPVSKSGTSPALRSDPTTKGLRMKSKSMSAPPVSDTPPPPTVKHFSETEWAEMSELQTQEALKVGTEKSLAEATQVSEGFLKEYPRSIFRPQAEANLLRTTAALVQLNPNLWCERAVAALEAWMLEKPPPAINVDAEIATIQGRCLK